jgi:hypothetical protein
MSRVIQIHMDRGVKLWTAALILMTALVAFAIENKWETFIMLPNPRILLPEAAHVDQQKHKQEQQPSTFHFQGVPTTYKEGPPPDSTVHCTGETFGASPDQAWLYRSCHFRYLCYDMSKQDFVLFPSIQEQRLLKLLQKRNKQTNDSLVTVSTVASKNNQLALAAVDPPHPRQEHTTTQHDFNTHKQLQDHLSWFPIIVTQKETTQTPVTGYYQLSDSYTFIPFQETFPVTKESLLYKDFISIFTLLYIFGLEENDLVLVRHGLTQTWKNQCDQGCAALFQKHLPAMGVHHPEQVTSGPTTSNTNNLAKQSNLVCAKYGAAGLGLLMTGNAPVRDKDGTWMYTHTVGRDATLRAFDKFMKRNRSSNNRKA